MGVVCSGTEAGAGAVLDDDVPAVGANYSVGDAVDVDPLIIPKKRIRRRGVDLLSVPDNASDYGRGVRSRGVNPCAGWFYFFFFVFFVFDLCFSLLFTVLAINEELKASISAWALADEASQAETERIRAAKKHNAELLLRGNCFLLDSSLCLCDFNRLFFCF